MKKEQILGLIRQLLTVVFSLLAAKWFKDGSVSEGIIASVVAGIATIWGLIDKSQKGLSVWFSAARHIVSAVAGVLFVVLPDNKLVASILGTVLAILAALSSYDTNGKPTPETKI